MEFDQNQYDEAVARMTKYREEHQALECVVTEEMFDKMDRVSEQLAIAIEKAGKTQAGTTEGSVAWDIVEELEAELSHLKSKATFDC